MIPRECNRNKRELFCQFCGKKFNFTTSITIVKDGFHPSGAHDYYEFIHYCKNGIALVVKGKTKEDVINKLLSEKL